MIEYRGYTGTFEYDPALELLAGHVIDRKRAGELLEEAIAGYQKLEAPLFEQIATEMLGRAGGGRPTLDARPFATLPNSVL